MYLPAFFAIVTGGLAANMVINLTYEKIREIFSTTNEDLAAGWYLAIQTVIAISWLILAVAVSVNLDA